MAEMQTAESGGSKKKGGKKVRSKKMSTRVDLTPMVDLGFLLITFFMLTTTLAKPQIMALVMPEKDIKKEDIEPVKESKVLTLLLGAKDKVYWYEGITDARLDSTSYDATGLRQVILKKKKAVQELMGEGKRPVPGTPGQTKPVSKLAILIKATPEARYKNVVDVFDEMKICGIDHYVMLDISPQEMAFIRNPAAGLIFSEAEQIAAAYRK